MSSFLSRILCFNTLGIGMGVARDTISLDIYLVIYFVSSFQQPWVCYDRQMGLFMMDLLGWVGVGAGAGTRYDIVVRVLEIWILLAGLDGGMGGWNSHL